MEAGGEFYHEKQRWQRCGVHTLNNLFQKEVFTKEHFDRIANALAPGKFLNPHKSMLGTGNYDINVLSMALQEKKYTIKWFDKRKDPSAVNLKVILGFIINTKSSRILWNSYHWFAIKNINNKWYNFDSKKGTPEEFKEGVKGLYGYLKHILDSGNQVFVVVPDGKADEVYKKDDIDQATNQMEGLTVKETKADP
ncbi:hypothetical protein AAMO2058_000717200 [Amorphochlora amoebiformis]